MPTSPESQDKRARPQTGTEPREARSEVLVDVDGDPETDRWLGLDQVRVESDIGRGGRSVWVYFFLGPEEGGPVIVAHLTLADAEALLALLGDRIRAAEDVLMARRERTR